ncbi:hypothetical protein [Bradyrhizobium sp. LVM 105]|uniref:hypothetical protein n=1 Tax=Bradyrhizobium sp. LVM 105 TaxID=2341115 RepID=UPI000F7FAD8D|nr:hypothetical protein [Bradyrhizobium sp. LVM 105]RTE91926.1 hypothetical protein D6B98_16055 [Bradyrhizobium sp. LVM 105]
MSMWLREQYNTALAELNEHRRTAKLRELLHRFVVETGKQKEFLAWLAKDMGLDKPVPFSNARYMTAEEMAEMEKSTLALDEEIKTALRHPR